MIEKRRIADTDIYVSPLGLGTVKLGRDQGVKYPQRFTIPDDRAAAKLLDAARALDINLIDTAPAYGNSEQRLGGLLKGQRAQWVICTKVGEEFEHGVSTFDFTPEHTRFSVERSLRRLQTDYLDIVLVHSDGNDVDIIKRFGTLDALTELKARGLIGAVGMSTKTIAGGLLAAEKSDLVMVAYNPRYTDEKPVLDYCAQHNKGVFIKKALASGHLSPGDDPVQASMTFIFAHAAVSSVIVGTIDSGHLAGNAQAVRRAVGELT